MKFETAQRPALIFDLDGTLIDSAISILDIINLMRNERGFRSVEMCDVRPHLSKGGLKLVQDALGEASNDPNDDLAWFRKLYANHSNGIEIVFNGVFETLSKFKKDGYLIGICTNKPSHLCHKALKDTGLVEFFDAIVTAGEELPSKPHPSSFLECCKLLNVRASDAILIGDSEVDRDTAANAGAGFVLVSYGYPIGSIDTISALAVCKDAYAIFDTISNIYSLPEKKQFEELL